MSSERSVKDLSGLYTRTVEPRVGVEPTTCRLRIGCSTTELPRPLIIKDLLPYQTYFRPTAIKLPSNCHHSHPKSALCSPTLAWLSSARPERPSEVSPSGDCH